MAKKSDGQLKAEMRRVVLGQTAQTEIEDLEGQAKLRRLADELQRQDTAEAGGVGERVAQMAEQVDELGREIIQVENRAVLAEALARDAKPDEAPKLLPDEPEIRFAKVVAVYNESNASWTDYATDGWQSHCTANPCDAAGDELDADTTLYLKLTEDCANANVGFQDVAVADIIGFAVGDKTEDVPGTASATQFDGYALPHAAEDGATLTSKRDADTIRVDKMVDVNLSDDNVHLYTLDTRDWQGRIIWLSVLYYAGAPNAPTDGVKCWRRTPTRDDLQTDMEDWVQPEGFFIDMGGNFWMYTAFSVAGTGDDLDAKILCDGDDGGKLKLEIENADGDRYQFWIHAIATAQKNEASPDITTPDA